MSIILRGYGEAGRLIMRGYGRIITAIMHLVSQIITWIKTRGWIGDNEISLNCTIESSITKFTRLSEEYLRLKSRIDDQSIFHSRIAESILLSSLLEAE